MSSVHCTTRLPQAVNQQQWHDRSSSRTLKHVKVSSTLKNQPPKKPPFNLYPSSAPTHGFNNDLSPSDISSPLLSSRPPSPTAYLVLPLWCQVDNGTQAFFLSSTLPNVVFFRGFPTLCHYNGGSSPRPRRDLGFPPLLDPPYLFHHWLYSPLPLL